MLIRKVGDGVILPPRPKDWRRYFESAPVASPSFMAEVEDLPVQKHVLLHHEAVSPSVLKRLQSVPVSDVCMSIVTKASCGTASSCHRAAHTTRRPWRHSCPYVGGF